MNNKIAYILVATLGSFAACSKSDNPTPPPAARQGFIIDLQSSAVAIGNIDSADVVFRLSGSNTRVQERFVKKDNKLVASTKTLTGGTWHADIELYTKSVNQLSHQYTIIKPIEIAATPQEIILAGPGATNANGWVKSNVKASAGNEVIIIVPDNIYDPRFEFRAKTPNKLAFGMQREAINVNYLVAEKSWACANNCTFTEGRLTNNTHFLSFTESIKTSPWTSTAISLAVFNEKSEILLEYDRTWNK